LLHEQGEINDENWGDFTLRFEHGRVTFTQRNNVASSSTSGTYTINGKTITLRFTQGVNAGETFAFRWSLYRARLSHLAGSWRGDMGQVFGIHAA
jgi:hypothetical protein